MNETQKLYQLYSNLAHLCHIYGVRQAVLSPGSRSAVPALSLLRYDDIQCHVIADERSAAYVALGISKISHQPTLLVCTSGTAAVNYAPAITEAYFQKIPLIALTADRPDTLRNRQANQTIIQEGIFGEHLIASTSLPSNPFDEISENEFYKSLEDVLINQKNEPEPIHINAPIAEPFYLNEIFKPEYKNFEKPDIAQGVNDFSIDAVIEKPFLVLGELDYHFESELKEIAKKGVPIFSDVLSNSNLEEAIIDDSVFNLDKAQLVPDLVFYAGKSLVSKKVRSYFDRNNVPLCYWGSDGMEVFGKLDKSVDVSLKSFLKTIAEINPNQDYAAAWKALEQDQGSGSTNLEEFWFKEILSYLPANSILHIGNSMPIRHLQKYQYLLRVKNIRVYGNRGTSGVDGSISTGIGHAYANPEKPVFVIAGDYSFEYDKNALWNNHLPQNITIVILNNNGGRIFGKIKGPSDQPEFTDYFVHPFKLSAESLSKAHKLFYKKLNIMEDLSYELFLNNQFTILEINCCEL